jgi:hypothetical protein
MSLLLSPKGRTRRLQRRALSRLCSPCSRPLHIPRDPLSSASSPFPCLYRVMGIVMIALVGVATFDKPGTGATSILQAVIFSKPEAPVEERHTGSLLLLLRFLRSCAWCGCRYTRLSDSGDDLQDPSAHGSLPLVVGRGLSKSSVYVRLSGAGEGSLWPLLLCRWLSLACFSHPPISNNLQVRLRKKRKMRRK